MPTGSFFNGINPSLWYSNTLFNQVFGTKFSPTDNIPSDLKAKSWASASNTSQLDSLSGLYERQYDVLSDAEALSASNRDSVFYQKEASSSDGAVADVAYFSGNNFGGQVPDSTFEVDVTSLAQNQINQGAIFDPTATTTVNTGTSTFTLTAGSTNYNLSIDVNANDTNEAVLGRMAAAINDAEAGLTATVLAGSGGSRLQITGDTGAGNTFSLSDVSGNAVSTTSADAAIQSASDAVFTVNGTPYSQANNHVFLLDGKLNLELKSAGTSTVTVSPDTSAMSSAVGNLMSSMNELSSYMAANSDISSNLASQWSRVVRNAASDLSSYGINLDSNNQFSLDTTELSSALNENLSSVISAFGGSSGIVSDIRSFSDRITSSPGANLLESPPSSGLGSLYLRSLGSSPRFRQGSSSFWQVV